MTQTHGSASAPAPSSAAPSLRSVGLVFVGGAAGVGISTLLRSWGLQLFGFEALPLLLVNVVGALLLGLLVGLIPDAKNHWRLLLGTGMLGGFTSFSAIPASLFPPLKAYAEMYGHLGEPSGYSTEEIGHDPVLDHSGWEGLILAPVSLVLGVLAAMAGLKLAQKWADKQQLSGRAGEQQ